MLGVKCWAELLIESFFVYNTIALQGQICVGTLHYFKGILLEGGCVGTVPCIIPSHHVECGMVEDG